MQVISRRENEGVVINGNIFVTVLEVRDDAVRLAISAPHLTPSYWEQTLFLRSADEAGQLELSTSSAEGF
jgi:carbon storage regulator CsrA